MDQLKETDPWVNLQGARSPPAERFLGFACPAVILQGGGRILPQPFERDQKGCRLSFGLSGGHIAPRIVLQLKIAGSNLRKTSEVKLEFFPSVSG